ncbi:MAG: hypothetical protein NWQ65_06395 [Crocinitomicaceae bacterium]|nr:hypothetical protein [Crocinitomicaceae bacterium]MDP4955694.1 hypothetical protein [Crocinitomicaceae bacterium]
MAAAQQNSGWSWTKILIGSALVLVLVGVVYKLFGGPRQDVMTPGQIEADSLRNVLRETQKELNAAEQKAAKKDLTPPLTLEQQKAKLEKELLNKEMQEPLKYLSLDYEHTYRWFAGKEEYSGQIYNEAKYATFMNFEIRVTFLSETKTALDSKVYTLYKYVEPGGHIPFKFQSSSPGGYRYHRVELIRAVPYSPSLEEYEPNEQ